MSLESLFFFSLVAGIEPRFDVPLSPIPDRLLGFWDLMLPQYPINSGFLEYLERTQRDLLYRYQTLGGAARLQGEQHLGLPSYSL